MGGLELGKGRAQVLRHNTGRLSDPFTEKKVKLLVASLRSYFFTTAQYNIMLDKLLNRCARVARWWIGRASAIREPPHRTFTFCVLPALYVDNRPFKTYCNCGQKDMGDIRPTTTLKMSCHR